jgi:hypothetical protein
MVSFLVCFIMMIVITLVVLGFSQVSRNELKLTLNRQLSAEAFYAADSGINNAAAIISADVADATTPPSTTGCGAGSAYSDNNPLSAEYSVSESCIIVNPAPTSLEYEIADGSSVAFPVTVSAGAVNSLTFQWNDPTDGTTYSGCPASAGQFSIGTDWSQAGDCDAGVLQIDLFPANLGTPASFNITTQETNADSVFLTPTRNAAYSPSLSNGAVYAAQCNDGGKCTATITGLNAPSYYLHVSPVYEDSTVVVCANNGTACDVPLYGAQADVDVTGKAQAVLERLDARVSLTSGLGGGGTPNYAVHTGDSLCKLLEGYAGTPGTIQYASTDPGCIPSP